MATSLVTAKILGHSYDYSPSLPDGVAIEHPSQGIWTWSNAQNGFRVSLVHFSSDPSKCTQEFVDEARKGISCADFEREYNIRWESFKGKPVYEEDFKRSFHVATLPIKHAADLPIVRGWDFGLYPACIYTQLWPGMRLIVLKEICESGMGLERFLEEVQRKTLEWFPNHRRFFDIVDPAGFARSPNDERTAVSLMASKPYNLRPIPGIQVPATRRNAVVRFMQRNVRGESAFLVDPTCKMVVGGFEGGYHYQFNNSGQLREKPEKNVYSHPHDALQYICTRVLELDLTGSDSMPTIKQPSYGFSRGGISKESHGPSRISRPA